MITAKNITKTYRIETSTFSALCGVDLHIPENDFVCIVGKSGSGKSTLLNMIAGIDQPTSGEIQVAGTALDQIDGRRLDAWRGAHLGIVFQFFQFIPTLTVWENVVLPMDFSGKIPRQERKSRALALLASVDMTPAKNLFPAILSGGEKQRVAIARALANDPPIILGDEPTGNLDTGTASAVFKLFTDLHAQGKTVVIVSHDPALQKYAKRTLYLEDGQFKNNVTELGHE